MMSRRTVMLGVASSGLAVGTASAASALVPTPRQPAGPFYPDVLPYESDGDLTVMGGGTPAAGEVIVVEGRVLGADGRPVSGAAVELWQANAYGRYAHQGDRSGVPLDPNFQGYGTVRSDAQGRYRFRTIRPGAYAGRTRHLHFYATGPGFERMPMQMYFAGDAAANEADFLYRSVPAGAMRDALTIGFAGGRGTFDIVLG